MDMIDALARHGDGLPANVLPVQVNEITQVGLEAVAASFAYGASAVRFLLRAKPRHDVSGLVKTIALAEPILSGLGFAGARVATIETDDPDALGEALYAIAPMDAAAKPATFSAVGGKRDVVRLALRELHAAAPAPVDIVPLPQGAPFGTVVVNVEGCTLCLSCVSACPTGALSDDPERPMLRFAEDACVQCGLCQATCPEKVISLKPQLDFRAAVAATRIIKQEEPALCIKCGKPFGVKSSVDRVTAKLEANHWMFKDSKNASRRHQDVRRLPRHRDGRRKLRSFRRAQAPGAAHHRRLPARTRAAASAVRKRAEDLIASDGDDQSHPHRHARYRLRGERTGDGRAGAAPARLALRSACLR